MDLEESSNQDAHKLAVSKLGHRLDEIYQGGGKKRIVKHHNKGKLTARERIDYLLDPDSDRFEIGAFAALGMYEEYGGAPSAGVVVVQGYIRGRMVIVVANDATVKAGAWFPMTGKKNLRAQEIAMENRIPIIYLVDSAGVFLPLQDKIFPDKEHFGRIFRNNARLSSMGVHQIAAVMGSCVAGGAYLPIMSDESLIVEGSGSIFLAGPYLVKAAIGENVDAETLGGAVTQSEISGIIDHKMPNERSCLDRIKDLVEKIKPNTKLGFIRDQAKEPKIDIDEMYGHFPKERTKPYPILPILEAIVDADSITQYKKGYGKTITCAYANINGWGVGIVANNRALVRSKSGETQFGGVIYSDAADKAARFIMLCNQRQLPLIFIHDVTGFMVGTRSEQGGIIKDGAKMVNAVANSTVPKISVIIGNSYGAGNYAMCGKAYDPRLIVAWPSARIAVMGGSQAAEVLTQIQLSSLKKKGEEPDEKLQKELYEKISESYGAQTSPYYAAARLWVDAIIDPKDTRKLISMGIEAANEGVIEPFVPGVFQV
ncbi:MAG: acyl-CoA carboxylase subunit beta [Saprospiraceae bacterium]|nr:acyl-CoA carboxylase subunit beta [Saprospiraceae bacterium]